MKLLSLILTIWASCANAQFGYQPPFLGSANAGLAGPATWDLEITVTNANMTFVITALSASGLIVNWGDGNTTNYTGTGTVTNQYVTPGTYTCSLRGTANLQFGNDALSRTMFTRVLNSSAPVAMTSGNATFSACSGVTNFAPDTLSTQTNITRLDSTFKNTLAVAMPSVNDLILVTRLDELYNGCYKTFYFSEVSSLTRVNTLLNAFNSCYGATNFPDVSTIISNTTLAGTWQDCQKLINASAVDTMPLVTTIASFHQSNYAMTNLPAIWATNTILHDVSYAFYRCYAAKGTAIPFWDTNRFPLIVHSNNCYTDCTNLTDYATIPTGWK